MTLTAITAFVDVANISQSIGYGFTLCGALGMAFGNEGAQYQASCSTFWGSFAFLIGSLIQLYESLDKHPVEEIESKKDDSE